MRRPTGCRWLLVLSLAAALAWAAASHARAQLLTTTQERSAVLLLGGGPAEALGPLSQALAMAGYVVKSLVPPPGPKPLAALAQRAGLALSALAGQTDIKRICLVTLGAGGLAGAKLLQGPLASKLERAFFIALPAAGLALPPAKGECLSLWRARLAAHYSAPLWAEAGPDGEFLRSIRQKGIPVSLFAGAVSARVSDQAGPCGAALAGHGGDGLVTGATAGDLPGWDRGDRLYLVRADHLSVGGQREVLDLTLRFLKLPPAGGSVAFVLAMDGSGSVKTTDRHNLRRQAARLLISRLAAGDQASVVSFNTRARVELPLTSIVSTAQAKTTADSLPRLPAKGDTDIGAGLALAGKILAAAGPGQRKMVVLLTDGRNDPESANGPTLATVKALAAAGVVVHAVGLTAKVDELFLSTLARAGNGQYLAAANASELSAVFDRLAAWVDRHQLVFSQRGTAPGEHVFPVDGSIGLLGVSLLSQKPGLELTLIPPGGGRGPERKAHGAAYFFESVRLPRPGRWRARVTGPKGASYRLRVVAATSLKVAVRPPQEPPRVGRPWRLDLAASQDDRPLAGVSASLFLRGPGKETRRTRLIPGSDTGFAGSGGGELSALLPPFQKSGNAHLWVTTSGSNRQGEPFQRVNQATLHVSDAAEREALDRTLLGQGILRGAPR